MADRELRGVSPIYEALCRAVAASPDICDLVADLPPGKWQPNLLLGVVRLTNGPIHDPSDFLEFVGANWTEVAASMSSHSTQTNEPGRCASLLPSLSRLQGPLALIEVGASAGLCLFPDRYRYRYRSAHSETHCLGGGPVELVCEVDGPVPLPDRLPEVRWRAGLDLNPMHADSETDREWLRALVWLEHAERLHRLAAALEIVAADPPRIDTADAIDGLPTLIDAAPAGCTVVVFHSAVLAYLNPDDRGRFTDTMTELHHSAGVQWFSNEGVGVISGTDVTDRIDGRFVLSHNQQPVALTAPHGQTLSWLAQ
ncbi:hypothetical protein ABIB25_005590 [Nakamurella sp. UYEF19]|uniref:DUF2332 domain-containing protein n=1 Tax=Nakamurella sp. UYEF19 TaxID=1756392 RepID=UPI0033995CA1